MMQGMIADTKMTMALALRPIPRVSIMMGTQPMGGIGRMRSKMGFTNRSTGLNHAMQIPSGMPTNAPRRYPVRATCSEAAI
ncbi:MAG: hypothetical protein A3J97_02575 [Spirochaetes bacterium RIFOXYC1_FULL_54_7]|nr:MAG: hypothetical protein A3J97_02575 [Spirochaetes bacterium RIFOXYC1_FULL_54_7]